MRTFYFERMEVWKSARALAKDIYKVTDNFPKEEKYGMTSQLRRATTSIAANIAEGMARETDKSKKRFINIAFGSAIEVINFLVLALDLGFITEENYKKLREDLEKITNQLNALHQRLKG